MGFIRSRFFRRTIKLAAFGLATIATLGGIRALGTGGIAHAASATYYPDFCLGGWDKPRHASGEVETGAGTDPSAFTADNSAILESDISSQIFCGYFPVEARDNPPASASIRLVWNFVGASTISPPTQETTAPVEPIPLPASATSTPSEASETPPVLSAEEASVPTPDSEAPVPTPAPESTEPASELAPVTPAPSLVQPDETPVSVPETATPPVQVAPTEPAPTSLSEPMRIVGAWISAHTRHADAQEITETDLASGLSDWFDVSYSLDGVRWKSIGRVGAHNWRDFTVTIPLASWEDLQNVQIMVAALPSLTDRPTVYLDGMELRIENESTLTETAAAAASVASDVVDSAVDAVSALGSTLASLFTGESATPSAPVVSTVETAVPMPVAKVKRLAYALGSSATSTVVYGDANPLPMPEVSISADSMSLTISGTCSQPYFVVATYRSPRDYVDRPRSFASNYADHCANGRFSYTLEHLPSDTPPGTYFLLLGEQGEEGPWHATTSLIPIIISSVEVAPTPTL